MSDTLLWKPEYSVRIAEIDRQHQKLFRMTQELRRSIAAGHEDRVIETMIGRLVNYTIEHFATEESLMEEHRFPGAAAHRLEHNLLTMEINRLQEECETRKTDAAVKLLDFLQQWQEHHILKTDMEYAEFLSARIEG
ncbi:MAG TPA: bacteriohemerythrin [Terriglobales bacterium]|nr:bacteriohemerythrin [Terriglobales bacterium]